MTSTESAQISTPLQKNPDAVNCVPTSAKVTPRQRPRGIFLINGNYKPRTTNNIQQLAQQEHLVRLMEFTGI